MSYKITRLAVVIMAIMIIQMFPGSIVHAQLMNSETAAKAGMAAGTFFATLIYTPVKVTYAIIGGVVGGAAYAVSGGDTVAACRVWTPSLRGTYLLTPSHLRGKQPIRFAGLPKETEKDLDTKNPGKPSVKQ